MQVWSGPHRTAPHRTPAGAGGRCPPASHASSRRLRTLVPLARGEPVPTELQRPAVEYIWRQGVMSEALLPPTAGTRRPTPSKAPPAAAPPPTHWRIRRGEGANLVPGSGAHQERQGGTGKQQCGLRHGDALWGISKDALRSRREGIVGFEPERCGHTSQVAPTPASCFPAQPAFPRDLPPSPRPRRSPDAFPRPAAVPCIRPGPAGRHPCRHGAGLRFRQAGCEREG